MTQQHTPGPWVWERVLQDSAVTEHTLKGPTVLCRFWFDNPPDADARLIAAAPELLAALKVMVLTRGIREHLEATDPMALEQARAAIAKAEGR
jgi:hypothetical protein